MVLQYPTDDTVAGELEAANPSLKVFMYDNPAWTANPNQSTPETGCTTQASDVDNNPSWILKTSTGADAENQNFSPVQYWMNIGNTAYQAACVAEVISLAEAHGYNGIYWDDVNAQFPTWDEPSGQCIPTYQTCPAETPNESAWQTAWKSFLTYAHTQIAAAGLLEMGNIGDGDSYSSTTCAGSTPDCWEQFGDLLDGAEEQSWTDGNDGLAQQVPWNAAKLADVVWSEANHKYALLASWNTTEAGNTYALAQMLLAAGGYSSIDTSESTQGEFWFAEYTAAQTLGAPSGAYTTLSCSTGSVYERKFASGIVLVNHSTSAASGCSLGGTYSGSGSEDETNVTSVSLAAVGPTGFPALILTSG